MSGNLPLFVIEVGIGFIVGLALGVAIGFLGIVGRTEPTAADVGQHIIGLHGVGHPHTPFLDVETDDRRDADRIFVQRAHVLGNIGDGGGDDDAPRLLIVERDGLLVLEGGGNPVVERHVKVLLLLARRLDDLLIGQALILVQLQTCCQV